MSQRIISQTIKKICEGCGQEKTYELVDAGEDTIKELQNWYTIVREVWVGDHFEKLMAHAYGLECVPVAAVKLMLPELPREDAMDGIDLDSLRAKNIQPN